MKGYAEGEIFRVKEESGEREITITGKGDTEDERDLNRREEGLRSRGGYEREGK